LGAEQWEEGASVASPLRFGIDDLDRTLIWIRRDGFPGHLDEDGIRSARRILRDQPAWEAVLVDVGASTYYRISAEKVDEAILVEDDPARRARADKATGYEMPGDDAGVGVGDGATLAGYPLGWSLISLTCPDGCTVLLTRYPPMPPRCPRHGHPMQIGKR
jgi:hypothetical protein